VILGEKEVEQGVFILRDMRSGEQRSLSMDELIEAVGRGDFSQAE